VFCACPFLCFRRNYRYNRPQFKIPSPCALKRGLHDLKRAVFFYFFTFIEKSILAKHDFFSWPERLSGSVVVFFNVSRAFGCTYAVSHATSRSPYVIYLPDFFFCTLFSQAVIEPLIRTATLTSRTAQFRSPADRALSLSTPRR